MKIRITILLLSLLTYSSLCAQEQLTFIKSFANEDSNPVYLGSLSGKAIFTISKPNEKGEQIRELWVTDGTEAGTGFISSTVPIIQSNMQNLSATNIVVIEGYLYFEAAPKAPGAYSELWRTNGTTGGTSKVMDITSEIPYFTERRVHLQASENFLFVTIYNPAEWKVEVNQYDFSYQCLNSIWYDNIFSTGFQPCLYKDSIYFTEIFDSIILNDTGIYRRGGIEKRFELNGKLYQFYRDASSDSRTLFVYDGKLMTAFPIILNALDSRAGYINIYNEYFAHNGQIYALIVGTTNDNSGLKHLKVELYILKEDGFKFQSGLETEPGMYSIESVWRDEAMVHIITREKNYAGNTDIVFKQHKIDIEKEYPAARSVNVIFETNRGDIYAKNSEFVFLKKDRLSNEKFIYHQQSGKFVSISEDVNLFALNVYKVSADSYIIIPATGIPADSRRGSEPYWYNSTTGTFKLLKDINTTPKGIAVDAYSEEFAMTDNPLLWTSVEEKGVILYKSDGTKEGTRPVKTISTKAYPYWEKRIQKDKLYSFVSERIRVDRDECQHCSYQEKAVSFITDGTENGTHLIEEAGNVPYIIKSGEDYYHLDWGNGSNDTVSVIKITPDGQREIIRKINTNGLLGWYSVENDFLLYFAHLPAADKRWVVSALTGISIDHTGLHTYWSIGNKRVFFIKPNIDSKKTEIYAYNNLSLLKLLSVDVEDIDSRLVEEELILYGKNDDKISVIDLKSLEVKTIPVLFKDYTFQSIRKIDGAYYCQFYKYENGANNFKAQLFKNNIVNEIAIPSTVANPSDLASANCKIINNTAYFYFYQQGLDVYRMDNNTFTKVASLGNNQTYVATFNEYDNLFFANANQKIMVWKITGTEEIADGNTNNIVQVGKKFIFDATQQNGTTNLYISDGTKAGTKLLKEFDYLAGPFKLVADKVYFISSTPETGNEPWETDGTPEGTKMVGDLWEGPKSSNPTNFKDVDGIPVCLASTPDLGSQLFSLLSKLDAPVLAVPNSQACEGDTIILNASKGYEAYKWIIDDGKEITTADNKLNLTKSGSYKVIASKGKASSYPSNVVNINFLPLPAKPIIKQENSQLSVTATGQLQWYFNGTAIAGATANTLTYSRTGNYSVRVTENACSVLSDELLISITSTEELEEESVYPNPASHKLIVRTNQQQPVHLQLINIEGKTVLKQTLSESVNEINLKDFNRGLYILKLNQHIRKIIIE